jgi:ATP-dependent helicase/nuclease subunit A
MKTLEAGLALAALQLWVDPKQPLAAAEIGRLLTDPANGDAWLSRVLEKPGEAYLTQPEVQRVVDAAERQPLAGPLAAFDAAIETAGVREACLRWGRAEQRLGNLDALRACVHAYVATCEREGESATVAGLVSYLHGLDDGKSDAQATLSGAHAVTVSTLHGAKGLEWSVTVLYEIDSSHEPTAFGIHVMSDRDRFDFADPLGGRWLRYWPDPFSPAGRTTLHEAVGTGPEHASAALKSTSEMLRLLYVGWTRARDRVVLAGKPGKVVGATLRLLRDANGQPLVTEPEPSCVWAGRPVLVQIREASPGERDKGGAEPGSGYVAAGPRACPPAHIDMSKVAGVGGRGEGEESGPPLLIQAPVDWASLGTAVHAFLAADEAALEREERLVLAAGALERWSVQSAIDAGALVDASETFRAWCERRWPSATWHREWPVRLRQDDGTVLVGYADMVLMGVGSFVLIDHKCLSGTRAEALEAARGFAGQAWAYAEAIAVATGRRAEGCFVHLAAHGCVVSVTKPLQ